jgi:hypothetical protein
MPSDQLDASFDQHISLQNVNRIFPVILGRINKISKNDYCLRYAYLSVRQPSWNNSAHNGRIFIEFFICGIFKAVGKIQVSLKSENKSYFPRRPMAIFNNISLSSS